MSGGNELLYRIGASTIALALFALCFVAAEIGFVFGRRARPALNEEAKTMIETTEAAMLTLLGLLLAFSFSMAEVRYEQRQAVVVEEANAIGTAYLRAALAPEPERGAIEDALRRYVDVRIALYEGLWDEGEENVASRECERLRGEVWARAAALGRDRPESVALSLLLTSLNETIDIGEKQLSVYRNHVPEAILAFLFVSSLLTMGALGYRSGITSRRRYFPFTSTLIVMIALTIFVIMDLDRPRRGLIRVKTTAMQELRDSIDRARAPAG
jgi:hypothetical protein